MLGTDSNDHTRRPVARAAPKEMMLKTLMFLFSVLLETIATSCTDTESISPYRLSKVFKPETYELDLNIRSLDDVYEGSVDITFNVNDGCAKPLEIHASFEYITKITEWSIKGLRDVSADYLCNMTKWDAKTDIMKFECNRNLHIEEKYILSIKYEAKFTTDDMDGFYKSTYRENGTSQTLVATQFEPIHARRAFPCFDEPEFKANFTISIKYPREYTALGNMPGTTTPVDSNYVKTAFETTPLLSTYLVAFIISKLEFAKPTKPSPTYDYRVYARKSAKNEMTIAREYGTKLLDTMGRWIGKPYESLGDKQAYQVAIPDFAAGAMENMGLITYREVSLLDEGNATSEAAKQRIITVIAHELSHQWFGDYATTDWWSDLWLNEGFATYFEQHLPSKVLGFDEDFELEKQFLTGTVQIALKADADKTAQPLSDKMSAINTLVEINQKFDELTYSKGGSIVRMMSYILGLENFQNGLRSYINDHHEINKNPENLLKHLQQAAQSNEHMKCFDKHMYNWIYTPGFPLVTATVDQDMIVLTQERFNHEDNADGTWSIPISYASAENPNFNFTLVEWMENRSVVGYTGGWIIFNVQAIGFYRVNYDEFLWNQIIQALMDDFAKIDVLNRAQLIDDIYSVARIGKVNYENAFELTNYLKNEKEYYPWVAAFTAFEFMLKKLDGGTRKALESIILRYIDQAFNGNDRRSFYDGHIGVITQVLILSWSCKLGQKECISFAKEEFDAFKPNPNSIDRNFRNVILCYGLKYSEKQSEDYNILFEIFKDSDSSIEQTSILEAMGCMNDPMLQERYLLETIKKDSHIRKQDAAMVFAAVYSNSDTGLDTALDFFYQHFDQVEAAYKGLNSISRIIIGMAEDVSTATQRRKLQDIIHEHKSNAEIALITDRVTKILEENKRWSDQYTSSIKSAIQKIANAACYTVPIPFILISLVLLIELHRITSSVV